MVRLPFLAFFGSLLLLVNNALSVPSSSNGHFQQQQLPSQQIQSYYHYGGEPANGDARRTDSEGDGRRQQQQQQIVGSRGNRRFSSDPFPSLPNAPTRKEPIMVFRQAELDVCLDLCELDCFQVFVMTDRNKGMEEQGTMWQCSRLKPPTRAFHEKVFSHFTNASPFDFVIFGLVLLAVLLCLLCGCYQCCCRQNPAQEGHHSNRSFAEERKTDSSTNFENLLGTTAAKANHLGNGGNSAERESLTNGGANQMGGDALIHPTPLSLGKNGGTSLSFGGRSPLQQHRKSHTFAVEQSAI